MSRILGNVTLAAALIVPGGAVALAQHDTVAASTWISDDARSFDLAELADGESRTFGEGEHRVTLTRAGDHVVMAGGPAALHRVDCDLTRDRCTVAEGVGGTTIVLISSRAACEEGDCLSARLAAVAGDPLAGTTKTVVMHRAADCDDGQECATFEILVRDGEDEGTPIVVSTAQPHLLRIDDGRRVLTCPEGDTTMRVEPDEVERGFLCPKHALPLEAAPAQPRMLRRIELRPAPEEY